MLPADVRHLLAYLTEPREEEGWKRFFFGAAGQVVLPIIVISLLALLFLRLLRTWVLVFIFWGMGQAAYQGFLQWLKKQNEEVGWRHAVKDPRLRAWSEQVREMAQRGTLPNRLHPVVGAELELLAEIAVDVRTLLRGEAWKDLARSAHWKDVRNKSLSAVDEAMHEALIVAYPYFRRSGMRKLAFQEMIEQDPKAEKTVNQIREVRSQLADLQQGLFDAVGTSDETLLTKTLQDLNSVRAAEAELDDIHQTS